MQNEELRGIWTLVNHVSLKKINHSTTQPKEVKIMEKITKEDIRNMTDYKTAVKVLTAMSLTNRREWFRQAHNCIMSGRSFTDKKVQLVMQHIFNASVIEFDSSGLRKKETKPQNAMVATILDELDKINEPLLNTLW